MSNIGLSDVEKLIDEHRDIVDFGTKDNAVDDGWIERAEGILGLKLTSSYKAFLKITLVVKLEVRKFTVSMVSILRLSVVVILFTKI